MLTYTIPAAMYDGLMHRVPFERGQDFAAKWEALRADGFTVCLRADEILACKIMCGEPLPRMA